MMAAEIAQQVQARMDAGDYPESYSARALLQEFDTLAVALRAWQGADDERWARLIDGLARQPALIADLTADAVLKGLDPRLATLEARAARILETLEEMARFHNVFSRSAPPRPQPNVTIRAWPSGWEFHRVRAPDSKVTLMIFARAGVGAVRRGSMRTVPANQSAGPVREGCEPLLLISISCIRPFCPV
jgi:hypothetical protein